MLLLSTLMMMVHLLGLALGVGSASVKLVLLFRCKSNYEFVPTYLKVLKPITRFIILGLILLTLSGIIWLLLGYSFTPLLIVKVVLVGLVWVLGPIIDNVVEPQFKKLAPPAGETASPAFVRIQNQYLAMEITATGIMYAVTIMAVLL